MIKRSTNIRSLVYIALFAALFIVMSSLQFKFAASPVPITLQTLAVALAGLFLGARNGFLSILIVVVLATIGLPLINGNGGFGMIAGPTGGFLVAFPFCALLVGFFSSKLLHSSFAAKNRIATAILLFVIFELFSSFFAYVIGVPWLMQVTGLSFQKAMINGCYPFLPGDAAKSVLAVIITMALKPYILRIQASTGKKNTEAAASFPTTV
ncbi:biotin transporter BioY [Paenibacillus sp. FSL H8-0537]|uniref:biotin transporter BioY n=1 Tax=Paenibacillus sp. FSL H8-0537 TaxID=2921399 RepID=UPI003100EED6